MRALVSFLVLFFVFSCLFGCAGQTTFEVAAGMEADFLPWARPEDFLGRDPVAKFSLRRTSDDGYRFCEYEHLSHWFDGPPFNDRVESQYDGIHCGVSLNLSEQWETFQIWRESRSK